LEDLIQQFRAHMDDADPTQLLAIMQKLVTFIGQNKNFIQQECIFNGYSNQSKDWTQHYSTFLNQSISLMERDIALHKKDPSAPLPSTDLINECITQLHFLMST